MTFSIIQKSQLEGTNRIDAEYYQPEYLFVNNILSKLKPVPLRNLISRPVVTGSTPKIRECKGDGSDIKFVKTDVVRDGEINFDSADLLPLTASRKNSEAKDKDVLVTIIGASYEIVGRVARVFEDDPKININQNIALIRPKEIIYSSYLETFLRSKFGRDQLWQQSRQTEQVNLNCREVENIAIPIFAKEFQEEIEKLVIGSRHLKFESIKLYENAENLLLEELGLKDFKVSEDMSYIVNYSETENVDRVDADYFQPKYEKLITLLKNQNTRKLSEIVQDAPAKFNPKLDVNYKYIELANINSSLGIIDGYSEVVGKDAPSRARRLLKTGDVLVSSIQGALQKTAIVSEDQDGSLASTGFFQLRSNEILPEVLLILAKSIVLQWQLERECAGTILAAVPQESLKRLIVPVLPKETQTKIADLVKKSHEARKKSKELSEEAKRKVEEMIEKGDKN